MERVAYDKGCAASVVSVFGDGAARSVLPSAFAPTASGFTWSPGMLPADRTSPSPSPRWVRKPAAIWERPALCTQTNRTLGLPDMG